MSGSGYERAVAYVKRSARPVERALYEVLFEGAPYRRLTEELRAFANPDGGFGHALEPDLRTPGSSVLATAIGLRMLRNARCPGEDPLVRGAVCFLERSFDPKLLMWEAVPADANDHPHAPWWHEESGKLAARFDGFRIIPRALVVALLHSYGGGRQPAWLDEVTASTVAYIESVPALGTGGGSDLEYAIELASTEALPPVLRERLVCRIRRAIPAAVKRTPEAWSGYCVTPFRAAPTPQSIGAELITDLVDAYVGFLLETQADDGAWEPTWSWGASYPRDWAVARKEWRGVLTVDTLRSLRAYGHGGSLR